MKKFLKYSFRFFAAFIGFCLLYNLLPEPSLPDNAVVDKLVVYKSAHAMLAFEKGKCLKVYYVCTGKKEGRKETEGDLRTPEGLYSINSRSSKSGWHKNLGISYPNERDSETARKYGVPPGGDIKIHGIKNGFGWIGRLQRFYGSTLGCLAVTDAEIDELYAHVPDGTPILILP